jgi:hypothetical protein
LPGRLGIATQLRIGEKGYKLLYSCTHSECFFVAVETFLCVQLYNNPYPFPPILSCAATPNHPDNRPLSEHKESDQSGCGAPKCAHQSNPGLLGRARVPVRLNQNQNDRTARASAGRTELASQSEAARATRLFATEQSGINGTRLYSEAVQGNRGYTGGLQGDIQK